MLCPYKIRISAVERRKLYKIEELAFLVGEAHYPWRSAVGADALTDKEEDFGDWYCRRGKKFRGLHV